MRLTRPWPGLVRVAAGKLSAQKKKTYLANYLQLDILVQSDSVLAAIEEAND